MKNTVDSKDLKRKLNKLSDVKSTVMPKAFEYFRSITPIRTGRARKNTRLVQNEIQAQYGYAQPLDQGRSSQAPDGMSKPTSKQLDKLVLDYVRKMGK